jgi:adenosylcobinamide kinase/adenosylcobinamide-phosphate guanylyltransferase
MKPKLVLIIGGARSGKSNLADALAARLGPRVLYVATAEPRDPEMFVRIQAHRHARPAGWRTVEAWRDAGSVISAPLAVEPVDVVLVDCLTLLVSNAVLRGLSDPLPEEMLNSAEEESARSQVDLELSGLLEAWKTSVSPWIVVTNEVGLGLVPPYPVGRVYRDLLGWANRRIAAVADHVYLMLAGLPIDVKALGLATGLLDQFPAEDR